MSWITCPGCGEKIKLFGESRIDEAAAERGIPVLAKLPIEPEIARLCDTGCIEDIPDDYMSSAGYMLQQVWENDNYKS